MKVLLFLALAAVIAAAILLRPRRRRPATRANPVAFRAVSIRFDRAQACPAVRQMAPRRFLCSEAPTLPLPECTAASCKCRFEHHADRRSAPRRADATWMFGSIFAGTDRRTTEPRGRRAEDREDDTPAPEPEAEAEAFDPTATYYDFIAQTGIRPDTGK